MTRRAFVSAVLFLVLALSLIGAGAASADDCVALGGVFQSGECQLTSTVTKSGNFSIGTPLRLTSSGRIIVPPSTTLTLTVAGDFTIDAPPVGSIVAISGNATSLAPAGATIAIQASGNILLSGNTAGTIGAQIRSNALATCAGADRAGTVTLTSTAGNVTLKNGSKVTVTDGCLGGEILLAAPSGSIDMGGSLLSRGGSTGSNTTVVRGGPITLTAANTLKIAPGGSVSSEGTIIGTFPSSFNYGADRVHLASGGNMVIQGIVQSVGGFNFGVDVFGGTNRCTGASRVGKPGTPTSCVELWVGGTLTATGGDPSVPSNKINGYISARSGESGLDNGTCCSWIDIYVMGDILLQGQPNAANTNGFLIDAQQASSNATGGTITMFSINGKVTASGRTFIADGATGAGGTGGTVNIEAAGPDHHLPALQPGQYDGRAADVRSNVDLGDSMQFARGANTGTIGGAGKVHVRSYNGQVTGGPVAVLAPGAVVTLPAGTPVAVTAGGAPVPIGTVVTLQASTVVSLPGSTFVTFAGSPLVTLPSGAAVTLPGGTAVTLPGGISSSLSGAVVLAHGTVITPPAGTVTDPSVTVLAGGCADRFTGVPLTDPTTGQPYACNEFLGVTDGGGIGQTELIVTLCVGWLYNGVTRPLAVALDHYCGGQPTLPPDVIIPIAPTIQIYGGRYLYDGFERPARGDVNSGFIDIGGGHRVAAVVPTAYGQGGVSEPLVPLPTVTYVDANNNPVTVPIQVGTYTATAYFPGNARYTSLTTTAPIIIYSQVPLVTVVGGIFRYDGQPHPATGVTTTDADTGASIPTPPTVVYYTCTPNTTQPSWTPATDPSCTTTAPVNPTTTRIYPDVTLTDRTPNDWIPVVAYFPGNPSYGPAWATARIAIWKARPSVTTATGGTFVYDGLPHGTTTMVKDGGTDGLSATYPTTMATVDPGTYTFSGLPSGVTYTSNPDLSTVHAVTVQAPVNAGTYPVTAVYPGDGIHSGSSGTNTIIITPRPVAMAVPSVQFACDGAPHAATGTMTYRNASGQTITLPGSPTFTYTYTDSNGNTIVLNDPPSTYGTYTVTATLPADLAGNSAAPLATATLTIVPKNTTMTATGGTYFWDGAPHPATGTVVYNKATIATPAFTYTKNGVTIAGAPVDVGTYTVTANMPPELAGCYTGAPVTTTITINPRTAVITVTGGTYVYDGQPHPAVGTLTCTGIPAGTLPVITYTLNGVPASTPVQVGVYTATASLPPAYATVCMASPQTATITIKAPTCAVPATGPFTYTPIAFPAVGAATTPYGVNDAGQIVGAFVDATANSSGFWLSAPEGSFSPPITAAALGAVSTVIYGINGRGQAVGTYVDGSGRTHGVLVTGSTGGVGGVFTPIDVLGATQVTAYSINEGGQIVGTYVDGGGLSHGFVLSLITFDAVTGTPNLATAVLTQIDASSLGATQTAVYGINDNGQVVGAYVDSSGKKHGFSVTFASADVSNLAGAAFTTIDVPGAAATRAYGLDDAGRIVGSYDDSEGVPDGFVFNGGTFNTLDAGGTEAHGINNAGQIVGSYVSSAGVPCGWVTAATCKSFAIGPSSMEGAIKLDAGDWVSGGYSFTTNFATPGNFTVTASIKLTGKCIGGTMLSDSFTVNLGTKTYAVPAGSSGWLPTGDQNNVLSWMAAAQVPSTICGGGGAQLDGSKGAVFTASISASPAQPGATVSFRFHYRDPAAKGKPNTNCTDTTDPNRNVSAVCGASWSGTLSTGTDCAANGAFTTYTQGGWGAVPNGSNPASLLAAKFSTVYPGGVSVGGTKVVTFTSASAIQAFLPQGGTASVLTASATNPTSTAAKVFGGQVLALRLGVDFSKAGITRAGLADLHLASGRLAGYTVAQVLSLANTVLGGNIGALPSGLTVSGLNGIVDAINNNFDNGTTNNHYLQ